MTLGAVALVSAVAFVTFPQHRSLVGYFLYVIPAHLLISFLSHEPALFAIAKLYPPRVVAAVACVGCSVAIILDYWLIGWFVTRSFVRAELDDSRVVRTARRVFARAPFVLILASAMLPVPFYPVKILAIVNGYPLSRFIAALIIGRIPRFWFLAVIGDRVQASNSTLGSFMIVLAVMGGWGIWRTVRRNRQRRVPPPA